jgi:hypothetical protein
MGRSKMEAAAVFVVVAAVVIYLSPSLTLLHMA